MTKPTKRVAPKVVAKRRSKPAAKPAAKPSKPKAKPAAKPTKAKKRDLVVAVRTAFADKNEQLGLELAREAKTKRERREIQTMCFNEARRRQTKLAPSLPFYEAGIACYRDGDDTEITADMLTEYGYVLQVIGRADEGEVVLRRALEMHTAAEREQKIGWTLSSLSSLMFTRGKMFEAEQLAMDAIVRAKSANDAYAVPNLMYGHALVLHQQGKEIEAASVAREALPLAEQQGRTDTRAHLMNMLGNMALADSKLDEAWTYYEKARELFQRVGLTHADAITVSNMGIVATERGELDVAISLLGKALRALQKIGDRRSTAITLTDRGNTLIDRGDYDAAHKDLERALAMTIETGQHRRQFHVRCALANLAEARGDLEDARAHHAEAEIVFERGERDDTRGTARMLLAHAGVCADVGDVATADAVLARALAIHALGDSGPGDDELRVLQDLARARIACARGERVTANTIAEQLAASPLVQRSSEVRRVTGRLRAALAGEVR